METKIKPPPTKSKIPRINHDEKIEKAYFIIVEKAINLLKTFENPEHRTYCQMDHSKNELNNNMVIEFLCFFWNITLQVAPHNNRRQIVIDIGTEGINNFGKELTTSLLRKMFSVATSKTLVSGEENTLIINYQPLPILDYYYRTVAQGETEYISISTVAIKSDDKFDLLELDLSESLLLLDRK
ncbi:hypothetical protein SAMN06265348_116100 [Pedobacter westerhofensis]|uniref:Uncharacterized protein n=1 Tax=Pedobacter westerhofensis TaxID=425512 RepID=A0A521FSB3_9SPHI|nr:hypothetical protein [Pedobacter westerhofensis]SMO98410.1 hypothetical protein SAMN06265348_116100 [Pedobacter westerhofensis]